MIKLNKLKEIRKDKDILQKDIAKYLGIKKDAYSKYETNGAIPSLEIIYNFSKYFEFNIDYVLGLKEKRTTYKYDKYNEKLIIENFKNLREKNKYSQKELASKLNITQAAISRYELGLSKPSLNICYQYIKLFKISFHDFCTKKLEKEKQN